jgi:RhoGEF domain
MWAALQQQRPHRAALEDFCSGPIQEPLEGLLIKPVQRIPQYKMLLEELLKCVHALVLVASPALVVLVSLSTWSLLRSSLVLLLLLRWLSIVLQ